MRAINIFFILSLFFLQGCSTIEVAKEVTKASKSVKTSIDNMIKKDDEEKESLKVDKKESNIIVEEKEKIKKEKKKAKITTTNQKKITTLNLELKTLNEINKLIGDPILVRIDGGTQTARFDTDNCRLFVYFNTSDNIIKSKYYEIRNTNGNLIEDKEQIKRCYQELKKVS